MEDSRVTINLDDVIEDRKKKKTQPVNQNLDPVDDYDPKTIIFGEKDQEQAKKAKPQPAKERKGGKGTAETQSISLDDIDFAQGQKAKPQPAKERKGGMGTAETQSISLDDIDFAQGQKAKPQPQPARQNRDTGSSGPNLLDMSIDIGDAVDQTADDIHAQIENRKQTMDRNLAVSLRKIERETKDFGKDSKEFNNMKESVAAYLESRKGHDVEKQRNAMKDMETKCRDYIKKNDGFKWTNVGQNRLNEAKKMFKSIEDFKNGKENKDQRTKTSNAKSQGVEKMSFQDLNSKNVQKNMPKEHSKHENSMEKSAKVKTSKSRSK